MSLLQAESLANSRATVVNSERPARCFKFALWLGAAPALPPSTAYAEIANDPGNPPSGASASLNAPANLNLDYRFASRHAHVLLKAPTTWGERGFGESQKTCQLETTMKNPTLKRPAFVTLAVLGLSLATAGNGRAAVPQFHQQIQLPAPRPAPQAAPPARQMTSQPASQAAPQRHSSPEPQRQPQPAVREEPKRTSQAHQQREEHEQAQQQKRVQKQQQEGARKQKEQQKQIQKQQDANARQQKAQQDRLQKQQQKEKQERARQERQLQKQQKEAITAKSKSRPSANRTAEEATNDHGSASTSANSSDIRAESPNTRSVYRIPDGSVSTKTQSGSKELTHRESQSVVKQVNAARANMSGMNRKPLPAGDVMVHPGGAITINAAGGRQYGVRANGTVASYAANGNRATFDSHGKVRSIHTTDMDIHRGGHGERTIVKHRADGSTLATTGRHSGYLERTVVLNNRTFMQRSVLVNGRLYTNTYAPYRFGGVVLYHYVPTVFYAPGFYGWAYYPWVAPFSFRWAWFGEPWYLGPNPYFVAYGAYPSASLWLTDYVIGQTLSTAYQLHEDALAENGDELTDASSSADEESEPSRALAADTTAPIDAETKATIEQEIKEQIALDNAGAAKLANEGSSGDLPSALRGANYVFVVSANLDVSTADQETCALEPGDILRLTEPPVDGTAVVQLRVASSKRMDCPAGVRVGVSLQDLQDMQNNFHSQVELGLGTLRANQGRGGFPAAPPDTVVAPPLPSITGIKSVSVEDVSKLLEGQQQEADKTEAQIATSAFRNSN